MNELLAWMMLRDEQFDFAAALNRLLKVHSENGLVPEVQKPLVFAKGIAFLKLKKKDVRPITIFDLVLRISDNLAKKGRIVVDVVYTQDVKRLSEQIKKRI